MNADRKKRIAAILDTIQTEFHKLQAVTDEEREVAENIPESMEEKKAASEQCADEMDSALSDLGTVCDTLENLTT